MTAILPSNHVFAGLPARGARAILADPAWKYIKYVEKVGKNRDAEIQYATMRFDDIYALPVGEIAAPDCHLFLWTTSAHLFSAKDLIKAWGFKPSSTFLIWAKVKKKAKEPYYDFRMGMGKTTRKTCGDIVLLGRRGNARRLDRGVDDLIIAPRREPHRKPDEVYERIERYCAGPDVELFARQCWPGWIPWGYEIEKFKKERRPT